MNEERDPGLSDHSLGAEDADAAGEREIAEALALLTEHGPLDEDEWIDLLVAHGSAEAIAEDIVMSGVGDDVVNFPDGRLAATANVVAGAVLTRRLTADEIAADILDVLPDLDPLFADNRNQLVFPGFSGMAGLPGMDPDPIFAERDAQALGDTIEYGLPLPVGTLAGYRPGDLVAVRIGEDGGTDVGPCTDPAEADLQPIFDEEVPRDGSVVYQPIIWQQMAETETFAHPTLPLNELAGNAGYVLEKDSIARVGFDFDSERQWKRAMSTVMRHGVNHAEARTVNVVTDLAVRTQEEQEDLILTLLAEDASVFDPLHEFRAASAAVAALDDRALMVAATDAYDTDPDRPDPDSPVTKLYRGMVSAGTLIARRAPVRGRAGGLHIAALGALRLGEPERAADLLHGALSLDDEWIPAIDLLATLALIRDDLEGARAFRSRLPLVEDPLGEALGAMTAQTGPEPGRNEPCWCGSGRKYKKCHLGKPALTAKGRTMLLQTKALEFLRHSQMPDVVEQLQEVRVAGLPESRARILADDPLASDVALIEGGVLALLVRTMRPILPEEDQLLAAQWIADGRSVYDVEAVRPGEGLTLKDLRTGERIEVTERAGSRGAEKGQYLCVRVVEEGGQNVIYGGIELVDQGRRTALIELLDGDEDGQVNPEELVAFLSARWAPPTMVAAGDSIGGGEPMVLCSARYAVADTKGIRRKLSRRYGKGDGDEWTWLDGTRVLGVIRLEADGADDQLVLTAEATTESRFDEVLAHVRAMDPDVELLDEERKSVNDMIADGTIGAGGGTAGPGAGGPSDGAAGDASGLASGMAGPGGLIAPADMPPEILEAMSEMMRGYERAWPDEKVPALGGRTPREAAADPTTRDDVIRLLDSMPAADGPAAMDPQRLRDELGL